MLTTALVSLSFRILHNSTAIELPTRALFFIRAISTKVKVSVAFFNKTSGMNRTGNKSQWQKLNHPGLLPLSSCPSQRSALFPLRVVCQCK